MDIGIFRCRRSTIFCEAWDESMNTRGNEPNKIVEAIGGWQRIHKLAKQEVKSLTVIIIIVFLWGVHKGGSIVGVCWPVRTVLPPTPTEDRPIQVGSIYS